MGYFTVMTVSEIVCLQNIWTGIIPKENYQEGKRE